MKMKITHQPGNSFSHRLHPMTKLIALLLISLLLFFAPCWFMAALLAALMLIILASRLKLYLVRGFWLMLSVAMMIALLQLIFTSSGRLLFDARVFRITSDGLANAITISGRFLCIILLSYWFVLTTNPNSLAYGLMQAGIPYRFGFMLVMALRFITLVEDEARTIYYAQLVRGAGLDQKGLKKYLLLLQTLLLPLLVSSLNKTNHLAYSMEGRSFGQTTRRTYMHHSPLTWRDGVAAALLFSLFIIVILF